MREKKHSLSARAHTHTHTLKAGDFQLLRNSTVIAGALLSIKTWPFQHMCAVVGAVGTGEEEDRGLPDAVVVWPNPPPLFWLQLPPKIWDLPLWPHVRIWSLERRTWLTHTPSRSCHGVGGIKGRTRRCGKDSKRQTCPVFLGSQGGDVGKLEDCATL